VGGSISKWSDERGPTTRLARTFIRPFQRFGMTFPVPTTDVSGRKVFFGPPGTLKTRAVSILFGAVIFGPGPSSTWNFLICGDRQ